MPTYARDDLTSEESIACTRRAVYLCATHAILLSMTPRQRDVFHQLCTAQMEDAGPHSLLPNVIAAYLDLARRPWWDRAVAGLPDEPAARRGM